MTSLTHPERFSKPPIPHQYHLHFHDRLLFGNVGVSLYDRRHDFSAPVWYCVAESYDACRVAAMAKRAELEQVTA